MAITVLELDDGGRPNKVLPRCAGELSDMTLRWRNHAKMHTACQRLARVTVNGTPLCRTHAGIVLLDWHLKQKNVPDTEI